MREEIEDIIESDYFEHNYVDFVLPENQELFKNTTTLYEKPNLKDRLTIYPIVFLSYMLFASFIIMLVNICTLF